MSRLWQAYIHTNMWMYAEFGVGKIEKIEHIVIFDAITHNLPGGSYHRLNLYPGVNWGDALKQSPLIIIVTETFCGLTRNKFMIGFWGPWYCHLVPCKTWGISCVIYITLKQNTLIVILLIATWSPLRTPCPASSWSCCLGVPSLLQALTLQFMSRSPRTSQTPKKGNRHNQHGLSPKYSFGVPKACCV